MHQLHANSFCLIRPHLKSFLCLHCRLFRRQLKRLVLLLVRPRLRLQKRPLQVLRHQQQCRLRYLVMQIPCRWLPCHHRSSSHYHNQR